MAQRGRVRSMRLGWFATMTVIGVGLAGCVAPPDPASRSAMAFMETWRASCRMDRIEQVEHCNLIAPDQPYASGQANSYLRVSVGPDGMIFAGGRDSYAETFRARLLPGGAVASGFCGHDRLCVIPARFWPVWRAGLLAGDTLVLSLDGPPNEATISGRGLAGAISDVRRRDARWMTPPPTPSPTPPPAVRPTGASRR